MIYSGDATSAFGGQFLEISLENPSGYTITKAIVSIGGVLKKEFTNPTFPITINLTSEETAQLPCINEVFMAVYDNNNEKLTCEGSAQFITRQELV